VRSWSNRGRTNTDVGEPLVGEVVDERVAVEVAAELFDRPRAVGAVGVLVGRPMERCVLADACFELISRGRGLADSDVDGHSGCLAL